MYGQFGTRFCFICGKPDQRCLPNLVLGAHFIATNIDACSDDAIHAKYSATLAMPQIEVANQKWAKTSYPLFLTVI